jgi:EAL and modified HD-GYP domain-containing signal transduction protein
MSGGNSLIGRQPILNRNLEIVAYELLFRSEESRGCALVRDGNVASASVIINTLSEFGFENILGVHKGLINIDSDLLMNDAVEILPRENVILELLESIRVTPELEERCRKLHDSGFRFALDDHHHDPLYEKMYTYVDIIKIDVLHRQGNTLAGLVEPFRSYPLQLLAEKVETHEVFKTCLDLGFELFQGYFFARPTLEEKKRIDETSVALLKLMRLLNEDADLEEIERVFRSRPGLTYKLLVLVNSVSVGLREKVNSVRHAMVILGRKQIKRWVQLALFVTDDRQGVEHPLVELAAVRASFMENLAAYHPLLKHVPGATEQCFMVGILSLLETIYTISMEEVVSSLKLSAEVADALMFRQGPLGKLLDLAELMEKSYCRVPAETFEQLGIDQQDVQVALIKAYNWLAGMG